MCTFLTRKKHTICCHTLGFYIDCISQTLKKVLNFYGAYVFKHINGSKKEQFIGNLFNTK